MTDTLTTRLADDVATIAARFNGTNKNFAILNWRAPPGETQAELKRTDLTRGEDGVYRAALYFSMQTWEGEAPVWYPDFRQFATIELRQESYCSIFEVHQTVHRYVLDKYLAGLIQDVERANGKAITEPPAPAGEEFKRTDGKFDRNAERNIEICRMYINGKYPDEILRKVKAEYGQSLDRSMIYKVLKAYGVKRGT